MPFDNLLTFINSELLMAAKDGDLQKVISFMNDDPFMNISNWFKSVGNSRNNTPLIFAAGSRQNNTEVIRTLIENGDYVHAMNNEMRTAIFEVLIFSIFLINEKENK